MRKLLFALFFLGSAYVAKSQNLTVEGTAPDLYINHTVAPKENFYSVGRLYNQAPKSIAAFNNITMDKGLTIGQHIKIPLTGQNLATAGTANTGETLIPLTHIVGKSETLFKIGNSFNAPVETLRKWNNLSSDNLAPGTALIVGNLKMGNGQTVAATAKPVADAPAAAVVNAPGRKETVVAKETVATKEATQQPMKDEPVAAAKTDMAIKKDTAPAATTPTVSQVENKEKAVAKDEPFAAVNAGSVEKKETPAAVTPQPTGALSNDAMGSPIKEAPAKTTAPIATETAAVDKMSSIDLGSLSEGAFAGNFPADANAGSLKSKNGEAATFKSTSGWQDKKYYVLMNDVTPGTILKITSADNKFVFAKVLGSMPEMKENNGIMLRISSAAASHLGIIDPKFPVQVSYYQ